MAAVRPATPFIGRRPELSRLQELIDGARRGDAAGVLLAGDAGIGKTSVVGEIGRRAAAAGMLVLAGRCVDLGSGGLPYLPFAEALTGLVRAGDAAGSGPEAEAAAAVRAAADQRPGLARLAGRAGDLPADRAPGDAGLDRLALFESVHAVLAGVSRDVAPVLLVVEDLHWADASTRDLVRFLLARLDGDRVLVVVTYRTDDLHRRHPLRPLLAELVRLPAVERVELQPFGAGELAEFLTAVRGGEVPDDVVRDIAQRSAGNAYFAEELLAAGPGGDRLPTALSDVLLDRLERLGPETQSLIRIASVIGASLIDDGLLRGAVEQAGTPLAGAAVDDALREAVAHHVLVPDGADRWAFRHALLQEAVYVDLLPGERVRLHATVARLLAAQGDATAAEQARHSLAAHELPQALEASLRAAAEARRRLAPAEALEHYEQVLQLWDVVLGDEGRAATGDDVIAVGLAAATAAGDAGQHERAAALARTALDQAAGRGDSGRVAAVRSRLAQLLYAMEQTIEESRDEARRAVADLPGDPSPERVWALAIEARVDVSLGEAELAEPVVRQALEEARSLGLLSSEADLLITLSSVDAQLGRPDSERHLVAAREVAERAGDQAVVLRAAYNTALNRWESGDVEAATAAVTDAIAVADRSGLDGSLYATQCRWLLVTLMWTGGDPDGALAAAEQGKRQLPPPQAYAMALAGLQVHVARDPERALEVAASLEPDRYPWDAASRLALRGEALAWLGRYDEAVASIRSAIDWLDGTGEKYLLPGIWMSVTAVGALADAAAEAHRRDDPEAVEAHRSTGAWFAQDARDRAEFGRPRVCEMGPEGLAWLARLDAEEARLTGPGDGSAADAWRAAVEAFGWGAHYEQARCRWRLAEQLLLAGDRDGARVEAAAAHEVAVRLGARPLREAVQDVARRGRLAIGGTNGAGAGGGGLTPRERDVMRLVAQGLTNRQIGEQLFISEKTASVHVSNVLAKLGVSGRAEAVAVASRRGLLDAEPGGRSTGRAGRS